MARICNQRNCRGSLSLEAAIVLPLLLAFGFALLALLQCSVCEIKFKSALDRTAAEISMLSPLIFMADESGLAPMTKGLSQELTESDSIQLLNQLLEELLPGQTVEALLDDLVLDLSTSVMLGPLIQKRFDYWLAEACSGQPGWQARLGLRRLFLDWQAADHRLWLIVDYELISPFGPLQRKTCAVVPLWTGRHIPADSSGEDSVWMMDNFARGRKIRQAFGANLPDNFPVIASFADGQATMIRSVDLTAPTYQSQGRTETDLIRLVDDLAAFQGAATHRSDGAAVVQQADIKRKSFLLVIPANAEQAWLHEAIKDITSYAASRQITIRVEKYGNSYRYNQDEQDRLVTSAGLRYHFNVAA
ncbi:MAG TPA: hypothetical protein DCM45_03420 [Clostridiales bacterium]|nr:hypothetical protein [Clostridiales bacterium]